MKKSLWTLACGAILLSLGVSPVFGTPDFKKVFEAEIVAKNEKLAEPFKKQACNTCHVDKQKKDVNNAFGAEIDKLIEGDAAVRVKEATDKPAEKNKLNEEFKAALEKVLEMKPEGGAQTYKEMFDAGKLPE